MVAQQALVKSSFGISCTSHRSANLITCDYGDAKDHRDNSGVHTNELRSGESASHRGGTCKHACNNNHSGTCNNHSACNHRGTCNNHRGTCTNNRAYPYTKPCATSPDSFKSHHGILSKWLCSWTILWWASEVYQSFKAGQVRQFTVKSLAIGRYWYDGMTHWIKSLGIFTTHRQTVMRYGVSVYLWGGGFQHCSSSCEINLNDQISRWVLKPPTMKIWSIMVDHEMSIPLLKEEGPYLESWWWKYEFCRSSWILNLNMILTTWGAFYGVLEGTKAMTSGKMPSTPKVGSYYQSEDGVMQASARVNALIWIVDAARCYNLEDLWSNWIAHFHTLGSFKKMN